MRNTWGAKPIRRKVENQHNRYKEENPFSLFDNMPDAKKAEAEFKSVWKKFVKDWRKVQRKYDKVGASDTMSVEFQVDWIQEHIKDIYE